MIKKYLILLFCLIIFSGCTAVKNNNKPPAPTSTPSSVPISNEWTTYTNDVFKFTISQPPGWEVTDPAQNVKPYAGLIVLRPITNDRLVQGQDELGLVKISISDSKLTVDEYIQTNICEAYKRCDSPKEAIEIELKHGIKAKRLQEKIGVLPLDLVIVRQDGHGPLFGGYIYVLALDTGNSLTAYETISIEDRKTTFGRMLQDFRFIE
jgi:hypothetical protein